jgi:CP family cyanate transporter-like MFS transporter
VLLSFALLWLGGFDLRVTLLAVPPMIPAIHHDLGLDEKGVSILTGLPVLLLAIAAIPGSLMIARLGTRRALVLGLLAIGAGSAVRGIGPSLAGLFAATFVMGVGVAVSQPVFPTLTREWFPARVALATAIYSNGLIFGEMVPASLTGPLLAPALGGSWPLTFAFWSLPALAAAALVLRLAPDLPRGALAAARRWWPDFRSARMWQVGLVMGFASAAYFGTNAFIPDFTRAAGRPDLKDPALTALNTAQLVASFLALGLSSRLVSERWSFGRLARRRWPFALVGGTIAAAATGMVAMGGAWMVVWAGTIGFAAAVALVLTLATPPLIVAEPDVARFSAGAFLIIYASSFLGPLVGGAAWDATHVPAAAFLTLGVGGLVMAGLATVRPRPAR